MSCIVMVLCCVGDGAVLCGVMVQCCVGWWCCVERWCKSSRGFPDMLFERQTLFCLIMFLDASSSQFICTFSERLTIFFCTKPGFSNFNLFHVIFNTTSTFDF